VAKKNPHLVLADAAELVRLEQVKLAYANLPVSQIMVLLAALALAFVQWPAVGPLRVLGWLTCMCLITLIRILLGVIFSRSSPAVGDIGRWRNYLVASAVASGLVWGSTAFLLYPSDSAVHQVFIAFVLAGMVAGAMTVLTPVLAAFVLFAPCALLPIIGRYLFTGDFIHYAMGWMSLLFLLSVLLVGRRVHDTIAKSLYLRFENSELIEKLTRTNDALEGRVRERTSALEEADRRKNEFLALLAHELRNPLAPMTTAMSLIGQASTPALRNHAVGIMRRQLQQMVRLVDDLLDASRIQKGLLSLRLECVEVNRFLASGLEMARPGIEAAGQHLTVARPTEPLFVMGDEARLAQMVSNILNNASKFTAAGGQIHLAAERHGNQVSISVKDGGIGIPVDKLQAIFDMFVQVDPSLKRARGGLGIGLSLVRNLVDMHGGTVKAMSEGEGRGSEFVIKLPLIVEFNNDPPVVSPLLQHRNPSQRQQILVVDDNKDAAALLTLLLRMRGHEVREAYDGVSALEMATQSKPSIVISDIGMPGMSGLELARALRDMFPHGLKLIAVSGYGSDEDKNRAKHAGFDQHFVKPVSMEDLELAIDDANVDR
jgi:signal transduction histidine kinase/ActR/RegA family two-component response regulator